MLRDSLFHYFSDPAITSTNAMGLDQFQGIKHFLSFRHKVVSLQVLKHCFESRKTKDFYSLTYTSVIVTSFYLHAWKTSEKQLKFRKSMILYEK
jgi:hypothetical protein